MIFTIAGFALLIVAMRDVVHELFHPEITGSISRLVMQSVWRVARALARHHRPFIHQAGPAVLVAVGVTWTLMIAVGDALIYLPHLPDSFNVSPTLPTWATHGFVTALYVSVGMMTSVGASDLTPKTAAMRMVGVSEPVLGLVLITAWITWVLSIYPVIADRRTLLRHIGVIRTLEPDPDALVSAMPREDLASLLRRLTQHVAKIASDLAELRVTYYFQNESKELTFAAQLPYALALARAAEASRKEPPVGHDATSLRLAIEALLAEIGSQFLSLDEAPPDTVIAALARDHLIEPGATS